MDEPTEPGRTEADRREWTEPLDWPTFDGDGTPATSEAVTAAVADGADHR